MSRPPHRLLAPLWREAEAAARAMETLDTVDAQLAALDPDLSCDPLVDQFALDLLLSGEVPDAALIDALSRIDAPDDPSFERFEAHAETPPLFGVKPNQNQSLQPAASDRRVARKIHVEQPTPSSPPSIASRPLGQNSPAEPLDRPSRSKETTDRPNLEQIRIGARTIVGRSAPAPVEDRVQRLLIEQRSSETVSHVQYRSTQLSSAQTAGWSLQLERLLQRAETRFYAQRPAQTARRPIKSLQESDQAPAKTPQPSDHAAARQRRPQTQPQPTGSSHGLARLAARFASDQRVTPRLPEPFIDGQLPPADPMPARNGSASRTPAPPEDMPRALAGRSDEDLADRLAQMLRRDARRQGLLLSGGGR